MKKARRPARAVFLDRDGVIIDEVHFLTRPGQMRLIPGAARAIRRLRKAGLKAVVVTNQSAIARGWITHEDLARIHARLERELRKRGARLDAVYYCPHHPRVGDKVRCRCRKPGLKLLKAARRRFGLDLGASYFIGDTTVDVKTARNAGCTAILVRTGKAGKDESYKVKADKTFRDLSAAADWIIEVEGKS